MLRYILIFFITIIGATFTLQADNHQDAIKVYVVVETVSIDGNNIYINYGDDIISVQELYVDDNGIYTYMKGVDKISNTCLNGQAVLKNSFQSHTKILELNTTRF